MKIFNFLAKRKKPVEDIKQKVLADKKKDLENIKEMNKAFRLLLGEGSIEITIKNVKGIIEEL